MFLGDRMLMPCPRRVFSLRIVLDAKSPQIVEASRHATGAVLPNPVGLVPSPRLH
jgi:hypothetical protein